MSLTQHNKTILLTGATGYVGGRLLKVLEKKGYPLRCMARRPEYLRTKADSDTEMVKADALDRESLDSAMQGGHTAFYLIHSMDARSDFEDLDRQAARNFGQAAKANNLQRIIYLGGLSGSGSALSPHLRSRQEVGNILRASGVEVIELQASIVIGSGSLSFEMIRSLVERLPVMITPRWVSVLAQPISIIDLLLYLEQAIELSGRGNRIFQIGGRDQVSYGGIMIEYARQRGLKRVMIPVPVLTPHLSSLWLGLVTPLYSRVGKKLINSIRHPSVVQDSSALTVFNIRPRGIQEQIRDALQNEDQESS